MGHVQTKVRNGKTAYVVRYTGSDGAEHSKSFDRLGSVKTPGTARYYLSKMEAQVRDHEWIDPELARTVLSDLMATFRDRARTESTRNVRGHTLDNLGPLSNMSVGAVKQSDVRAWVDELLAGRSWADGKKVSVGTARTFVQNLRTVFEIALDDKLVAHNPCRKVTVKASDANRPTRSELLTADEIQRLRKAADDTVSVMMLLSASTGLRSSEIAGLRVRDVDFLRSEVHVVQQAARNPLHKPTDLKTRASRRTVPLPSAAHRALGAYLKGVERGHDSVIFRTAGSGVWSARYMADRFRAAAGKSGVQGHSWHSLRHYYASLLIEAGESVKVVQTRLGHANATVTLQTYTHLWPNEGEKTRGAVDAALG